MPKASKDNKKSKKSYSKNNSKNKPKNAYSNLKNSSPEEDITLSNLIDNKAQNNSRKSKIKLRKGQWSLSEDILLKEWIEKNGPTKWQQCGRYIKGRNGKQCREHWNECLNPELIKGEWTAEEDFLIMHFYEKCNGSWTKIVNLFTGRNKNSIKNRFYCELRKITGKDMKINEKKNCSKIKLEELKNNLEKAITISKNRFLNEKHISEEELDNYINKIELKIGKKPDKEVQCINYSLNANLENLKSTDTYLENENKDATFIKKRKRKIDSNSDIIIKYEKNEQEENNIIDLVENNKNTLNNNEISTIENNEFKFSFEKSSNISNTNNNIFNNSKIEEKNDDNRSINSRNTNPFDIKFFDSLSPMEDFKETTINYMDDSCNNLSNFKNQFDFYNNKNIDYFDEKEDMNFYESKIDLF